MARLRPASAYRRIKRAYSRKSKYKKKSFIRGVPGSKVVMYDMGNKQGKFSGYAVLKAKKGVNLRHNAIEAARVTANKYMEITVGKDNFAMKVRVVPHNVMRENPLASGAGADRMQTGMAHSYGKPIGFSAHVKTGKVLFEIQLNKEQFSVAKEALRKAASKLPIPCSTEYKIY